MNVNNINQMHGSIVNLLQQSRLKEAQTQAEALESISSLWLRLASELHLADSAAEGLRD